MRIYHDSDYTSFNDNEAQVSSHASSHGTNFDYNNMVERHYYDYNSDDMVENVYDYYSCSMCGDIDNMQEERTPITTMFKSGTTKGHGKTYFYGSSSRRCSDKKATMSSSYGATSTSKSAKLRHSPSTSRRSHDKAFAKSDKLRHSPSTSRRRHEKDNAKSAKPRHSTTTRRRHKMRFDK